MSAVRNLFIVALLVITEIAAAQTTYKLTDSIPVDPDVKIGRLENGLVYYIRYNPKPENRVEMRLAVNAGSILETDNQLGLAHFTEHMCFNGTLNFPKNALVDFLQKSGVKFGADINAYTSFDETVYMLQLPTEDKELLGKGFQVLEDWAHNVTLDGKEIDKERGIITEEWRLGLGADDRMRKKYMPVVLSGSHYGDRMPIGDINIIKTFKHDTLRQFYKDWYRPDLQAIVIVGDIDITETEQAIIDHFAKLKNPDTPKKRSEYDIPGNSEPLVSIATDKEATSSAILIFHKCQRITVNTIAGFRQKLINDLYCGMLNQRFREITQKPDAPFVSAYNYYGGFLARSRDAYTMAGQAKENQIEKALEAMLVESQRVKKFGFLPTEMERQKDELLNRYSQTAKEFDKTESGRFARQYVSNFLNGSPIAGVQSEFEIVSYLLPGIELSEINARVTEWITGKNMVIVITAPEKEGVNVPSEQVVKDLIKRAENSDIEAFIDEYKDEPLLSGVNPLPVSGVIKKYNSELDFTELILTNGVKVIVKKTDFKNDEILFSAFSFGGTSLYSDEDYISALFSDKGVNQSGVGNFSNTQLEKKLKGKTLIVTPYIDDIKEGINGKAAPRDLETLLQLTYLYFTAPRKDSAAFSAYISRTRSQMKYVGSNPVSSFMDTLIKTSSSNSPRVIVLPDEAEFDRINFDKAFSIYNERFADAGDFTFFFVGNIDPDTYTPLLNQYLGQLPVKGIKETFVDAGAKFPVGATNVEIRKGTDPKSMVGIVFSEKFEWNDSNRMFLRMLKEIISIKLIEVIREELSGVYSPQIQLNTDKYPSPEYSFMLMFGCSPKNTKKLSSAVFGIIEKIKKKGPTESDLQKAKEALIREREVDIKQNKFWLGGLESIYFNNDAVASLTEFNQRVNEVTLGDLKSAAQRFFVKDHYVKAVLLPEKK